MAGNDHVNNKIHYILKDSVQGRYCILKELVDLVTLQLY